VHRRAFAAATFREVMDAAIDIQRSLKAMNIMYDDKVEWIADAWKGDLDASARHRATIVVQIQQQLVELHAEMRKLIIGPDGIVECMLKEEAVPQNQAARLQLKLNNLLTVYVAAREKHLKGLQDGEPDDGMSSMDRLRLTCWIVSLRNIAENLIVVWRALAMEYWDRSLDAFVGIGDSSLTAIAGKDRRIQDEEWEVLITSNSEEFHFIPSGNRYA